VAVHLLLLSIWIVLGVLRNPGWEKKEGMGEKLAGWLFMEQQPSTYPCELQAVKMLMINHVAVVCKG
jgi:hypothetical protein